MLGLMLQTVGFKVSLWDYYQIRDDSDVADWASDVASDDVDCGVRDVAIWY